jgi:hypothetical protein
LGRADCWSDGARRRLILGVIATDTQLKRRLQAALGERFSAPLVQKGDTTEIWIGAQDVTEVMRTLHDDEQFEFELLADLAGVDTGS